MGTADLRSKVVLQVLHIMIMTCIYAHYTHTAVLEALNKNSISGNDVLGSVITISRIAEDAMGGTSGALYSSVKFPLI
jgi:hypothetical protein